MKKITFIILVLLTKISYAQSDSIEIESPKISKYLIFGVSISNGKFSSSSHPSVEAGIMKKNICLGLVAGRSCFFNESGNSHIQVDDNIREYFGELKTTILYPINNINCLVLLGVGGFIKTNKAFIEYGGGISYNRKILSYRITLNNWNKINYITPSLVINF